jgi:hypothetical protein
MLQIGSDDDISGIPVDTGGHMIDSVDGAVGQRNLGG